MRILYVSLVEDILPTSGVLKKVLAKVTALNSLEVLTDGISISSNVFEETLLNKHFKILPYKNSRSKFFSNSKSRKKKLKVLANYLKNNAINCDIILFRYNPGSYRLTGIIKKYGHKIVFEHNTKELEELKLYKQMKWRSYTDNFRPGYLLTYLESQLNYWNEKIFGSKQMKYARYGIAVTNEIAIYEQNRTERYKCFVISNGIDVLNKPIIKKMNTKVNKLNLIMILGYSAPWHGTDRVLAGLLNYKGNEKIKVNLIGKIDDSDKEYIKISKLDNLVNVYPTMHGSKLDEILENSDIGIGSLSIYRKDLFEASPLKTRDYLARGLPVIVGHHDTDLEKHKEFEPFYLKVLADDSPLDFEKVINFYNRVYQIPNVNQKIRDLAVKYLDTKVKMRELINVINSNS